MLASKKTLLEGKDSVHHKMARRDGCVQGGVQGALHQKIAQ